MLYTLWVGFIVLFYKGKEKKSKWKKKKQRYDSCVENFLIRTHQHGTVPQEITEPAPVAFAAFSVNPQICWIHIYCSFNSDDETAVHTGGTPYMPHGYVPLQREWFLCRFGMKTGMEFAHVWSGIGCGFRGNYESVWTYLSFQFQMNQKARVIWEFEMDFKTWLEDRN